MLRSSKRAELPLPARGWVRRTVLAAGLLCLSVVLPAQALEPLEDEDLQQLVNELVPVVEKVCARKFQAPPIALLSDAGDMMRVFRVEIEPQVARFYRGQAAARIRRAVQLRADLLGNSAIGKYELSSGRVLVVPERVTSNMRSLGIDDADERAVLQLFVAHELVHALQDQEMQFGRRYANTTAADVIDSLVLRTEGHAVLCSELVMRELGKASVIAPSRAIIAGSKRPLQELGSFLSVRQTRCRPTLMYLTGADLLAEAYVRGGIEQVWQIVRGEGPIGELLRPQPKLQEIANLEACFGTIGDRLGGRTWCVGSGALSEVALLSENYSGRVEALQLLSKCSGGAAWQGNSGTPLAWRAATVLRFVDVAATTAFRELAERCACTDLCLVTTKQNARCEDGPEFADGVSRMFRPDETFGTSQQAELYWFQRGVHLLQITLVKAPMPPDALAAIADEVLQALEQQASRK